MFLLGSCGGPGWGGKPVAANHCLLVAVAVCGSRLSCSCKVGWNCNLRAWVWCCCRALRRWCCCRRAWRLLLWCEVGCSWVVVVEILVPKGRESGWLSLCLWGRTQPGGRRKTSADFRLKTSADFRLLAAGRSQKNFRGLWWRWRFVDRGCRVVARLGGIVLCVGVVGVVLGGCCCGVR